MKLFPTIARCLAVATLLSATAAQATVIYNTLSTPSALNAADPTELGRPSRSGQAQTWPPAAETYTGQINTGTAYHYRTISIAVGLENYLQISFDDANALLFIVAYQGAYDVNNRATGWLGDEGASGEFPGDMGFFNVVAAANSIVTLVVNDAQANNGGLGSPFGIMVEAFLNQNYDELAPAAAVPEPSTVALSLVGLMGIAAFRRRRARSGSSSGVALAA